MGNDDDDKDHDDYVDETGIEFLSAEETRNVHKTTAAGITASGQSRSIVQGATRNYNK